MNNWKEQLAKDYFRETDIAEVTEGGLQSFIQSEIVEKLVYDAIQTADDYDTLSGLDHTGFQQQLRERWLQ